MLHTRILQEVATNLQTVFAMKATQDRKGGLPQRVEQERKKIPRDPQTADAVEIAEAPLATC